MRTLGSAATFGAYPTRDATVTIVDAKGRSPSGIWTLYEVLPGRLGSCRENSPRASVTA